MTKTIHNTLTQIWHVLSNYGCNILPSCVNRELRAMEHRIINHDSGSEEQSFAGEAKVRTYLKLIRYGIGGALLGIYLVGFLAPLLGFTNTSMAADLIAAVGGASTVAVLAKAHVLTV
jgi:hypothetical protein